MTWGPFLLTLLIGGLFGYATALGPTKGALICIALTVPLAFLAGWLVDLANAAG